MIATVRIPAFNKILALCLGGISVALMGSNAIADQTWTYTVEISATVQVSPPQITLHWEADDPYGVTNWTIFRKTKDATSWNFITSLGASVTNWSDSNVTLGSTYEYQMFKGARITSATATSTAVSTPRSSRTAANFC
jgi:hypothetical protein